MNAAGSLLAISAGDKHRRDPAESQVHHCEQVPGLRA